MYRSLTLLAVPALLAACGRDRRPPGNEGVPGVDASLRHAAPEVEAKPATRLHADSAVPEVRGPRPEAGAAPLPEVRPRGDSATVQG
jgi:hypothetical protein